MTTRLDCIKNATYLTDADRTNEFYRWAEENYTTDMSLVELLMEFYLYLAGEDNEY